MKQITNSKYFIDQNGIVYNPKGKIIKPFIQTSKKEIAKGHSTRLAIDLDIGRKILHRLVAEELVSGYFDGAIVDHIDRNTLNNHPSNLRWVTYKTNRINCDETKRIKNTQLSWKNKNGWFVTPYGKFETATKAGKELKCDIWKLKKEQPSNYFYEI